MKFLTCVFGFSRRDISTMIRIRLKKFNALTEVQQSARIFISVCRIGGKVSHVKNKSRGFFSKKESEDKGKSRVG